MNTAMTITFTVNFIDEGKRGENLFDVLIDNNVTYSYIQSSDYGQVGDFTVTIDNYFQYQALGDFLYGSRA